MKNVFRILFSLCSLLLFAGNHSAGSAGQSDASLNLHLYSTNGGHFQGNIHHLHGAGYIHAEHLSLQRSIPQRDETVFAEEVEEDIAHSGQSKNRKAEAPCIASVYAPINNRLILFHKTLSPERAGISLPIPDLCIWNRVFRI